MLKLVMVQTAFNSNYFNKFMLYKHERGKSFFFFCPSLNNSFLNFKLAITDQSYKGIYLYVGYNIMNSFLKYSLFFS